MRRPTMAAMLLSSLCTIGIGFVVGFGIAPAISRERGDAMIEVDDDTEREIATYPHIASATRAAAIRAGYATIVQGMSSAQVRDILGAPDEVRRLYAPVMKKSDEIGWTYWYVLRRMAAHGSQNERQESLVRVSFDLQKNVTGVDAWGLEP